MGSLMAGWSSPFRDPEHAKFQRNKSLTREEIDAYWRSTSKNEEEQLTGDVSSLRVQRKGESSSSWDIVVDTNRWWTRSASAFLNEAPVMVCSTVASEGQMRLLSCMDQAQFNKLFSSFAALAVKNVAAFQ